MKKGVKSFITLLLAAGLICGCVTSIARADNTGVCFTSVNDTLLELNQASVFSGGAIFVPARALSNFGIYYSFFTGSNTAQLYSGSKSIFFDLNVGNAYDLNYNYYSASAFSRNGTVYVPAAWTCSFFGLSYSHIAGNGHGDIFRMKNGSEVLSDSQFLSAATSLMTIRYNEYYGSANTTPTPNPSVTDNQGEKKDRSKAKITVSFIGLPSDAILDTFDTYGKKACFFITAQQAKSSPNTVRRIVGSGHSLGVYCDSTPSESIPAAQNAIYSAAQTAVTLVTSNAAQKAACIQYSAKNAVAYFTPNFSAAANISFSKITAALDASNTDYNVCITIGSATNEAVKRVLQFLTTNKFNVSALRETSF